MQLNVVIRPFEGARKFAAGEIVDVDGWRLGRHLAEHRYIRPATESEISAATAPMEMDAPPTRRGKTVHLGE